MIPEHPFPNMYTIPDALLSQIMGVGSGYQSVSANLQFPNAPCRPSHAAGQSVLSVFGGRYLSTPRPRGRRPAYDTLLFDPF